MGWIMEVADYRYWRSQTLAKGLLDGQSDWFLGSNAVGQVHPGTKAWGYEIKRN